MNIYISLPITGVDIEEVEASIIFATGVLEKKGHTAIDPLTVCSDQACDYETCIGKDIEALLRCDAIVMLEGWSLSKGCRLEWEAADIYGKARYKSLDDVPESSALWHRLAKEE